MQYNLSCSLCNGEAKLACACAGHEVMFCLLHYNCHLQDKSKPHTFTTLKKPDQSSNLQLLKKMHKLDEISIELLSLKDKISNHLDVYNSIKADLINMIQEIFVSETYNLELTLTAIEHKKQEIELFKQSTDPNIDQIVDQFDKEHLMGVLGKVPELNPADLSTISSLLFKKLGLSMNLHESSPAFDKELLEGYNKSLMSQIYFNMVQSQTYQELLSQNEDMIQKIENFKKELNSYIRRYEANEKQNSKLIAQIESYKNLFHSYDSKIKILEDRLQKYIVDDVIGDNGSASLSDSQIHDQSFDPYSASEDAGFSSFEEQPDTIVRLKF